MWGDLRLITIQRHNTNFEHSDGLNIGFVFKNNMINHKELVDNWLKVDHIDDKNKYYVNFENVCTDFKEFDKLLK